MRRLTKLMAAMLVVNCATTMVPEKAEASLYDLVTAIVGGNEYENPDAGGSGVPYLSLLNSTDRSILLRQYTSWGGYSDTVLPPGKRLVVYGYEPDGYYEFYIELYVYNKYKKKWVLKDIDIWGNDSVGEAIKVSRGDFRLNLWRHLR